jgi:hypothetical protein
MTGHRKDICRILVGKPLGKCPFGRPGRWKENIKMNIRELGFDDGR